MSQIIAEGSFVAAFIWVHADTMTTSLSPLPVADVENFIIWPSIPSLTMLQIIQEVSLVSARALCSRPNHDSLTFTFVFAPLSRIATFICIMHFALAVLLSEFPSTLIPASCCCPHLGALPVDLVFSELPNINAFIPSKLAASLP